MKRGICGRRPVLTPAQQQELRAWAAIGTNRASAARYFGVSGKTIGNYLYGRIKIPIRNGDQS